MDEVPFLVTSPRKRIERNQLGIFGLAPDADTKGHYGWSIILKILTAIVVTGLLFITMASAAPVLDLSPSSGGEGNTVTVTVTGSSFDVVGIEFAQATIKFNGDIVKRNVQFNGNGFTTSFIIPSNTPPGTYIVEAIGPKNSAQATFTVTGTATILSATPAINAQPVAVAAPAMSAGPATYARAAARATNTTPVAYIQPAVPAIRATPVLELSPSSGRTGDTVTVTGNSFDVIGVEFAQATIKFNGDVVSNVMFNGNGFRTSFMVPSNTPPGYYTVESIGPRNSAQATVRVLPPILELSLSSGREGDTVTVTGSSFDVLGIEFAQATLRFNGNIVKSNVMFNGNGFTTSFIIPANTPPGYYTVEAIGPRNSAQATFTVMETLVNVPVNVTKPAPILELSPSSGREGDTITVTGSSFNVVGVEFAQATIKFNGDVIKNVMFNGNGFRTSFDVPANITPGPHTVEANGPRNSVQATFTVMETPVNVTRPTPVLDLSPSSGREGDTITVTGSSFNVVGVEFAQATIKLNGNIVKSNVMFNGNGFTTSFMVSPNTPPGTYKVEAIGPRNSAQATFTVVEGPLPLWPIIGLLGIAAGVIVIRCRTRSPVFKTPSKRKFPKPPIHIGIQNGVEYSSEAERKDTKLTNISVDIRSGIWKEGGEARDEANDQESRSGS